MYRLKSTFAAAAIAFGLFMSAGVSQAASVFDFSYGGDGYYGYGEFLSNDVDSTYYITAVSGFANGEKITGMSTYAGASNLLSFPDQPYVDFGGISFKTATNAYNLFTESATSGAFVLSQAVDSVGYASNGVPVCLDIHAAVPEPATWAIMLMGFGAMGVALRGSRRRALATVAA